MKEYALYKGDEFLAIGTAKELAEKFNVKPRTIKYWSYPNYHKKDKGELKLAFLLEDDDDDE